jgi:hypothetical protein
VSLLIALLAAARNLPWQAWAVACVLGAAGLYGCDQYRRGEEAASVTHERQQQEKADAARQEVDRLRGGADRSRVRQFDRD